jgi:D-aspartate ligase
MDLVRAIGLAGVECAVMAWQQEPVRASRFTKVVLERVDPWESPDEWLDRLLRFGGSQPEPPVLYYGEDGDLLAVSRARDRLRPAFRFVAPDAALVEDLLDKARFQALAERLDLPVPPCRRLGAEDGSASGLDLRFPVVVKPLTHEPQPAWSVIAGQAKAVRVETRDMLRDLIDKLLAAKIEAVAQELVPGPETRVESYHVYVDEGGEIAGEFTGAKIRTAPKEYGQSTAVQTTDRLDVAELGRQLVDRLALRGVAKFDFKRAPNGRLYLLEINPRFNLWHHVGARAGVNLPELVYADLVGIRRPRRRQARAGVRWCYHWRDAQAAKANGIPFGRWLRWAIRCEAKSSIAWDDPMPILMHAVWRVPYLARRQERKPTKVGPA